MNTRFCKKSLSYWSVKKLAFLGFCLSKSSIKLHPQLGSNTNSWEHVSFPLLFLDSWPHFRPCCPDRCPQSSLASHIFDPALSPPTILLCGTSLLCALGELRKVFWPPQPNLHCFFPLHGPDIWAA